MKILTTNGMKQAEAAADRAGHSYYQMMQLAGDEMARAICAHTEVAGRRCVVFCGRGNNGGDGYVVALRLAQEGAKVRVAMAGGPPTSAEAATMYERAVQGGIPVIQVADNPVQAAALCAEADFLVDGLLGTGLSSPLRENIAILCRVMNHSGRSIYAIDLPTGVCADTGEADLNTLQAVLTVTFDSCKPGHMIQPGRGFCGEIHCADIGITPAMHRGIEQPHRQVDQDFVMNCLPKRPAECHKGDFGKLLAISGSSRYMGASLLSTLAALRSGTGYVTLAAPGQVCSVLLPTVPECVMLPCAADETGELSFDAIPAILERLGQSTAVLLGCGLGVGEGPSAVVETVLASSQVPVLLDADGINIVARDISIIKKCPCEIVLTPHPAEFARLAHTSLDDVMAHRFTLGRSFAQDHAVTLLLKGAVTTVFTPEGKVYYSGAGNPGMAKAGSGDVLAGVIGSLLAQGLEPHKAAACGAWLHGRAGSLAAQQFSQTAMLPREIVGCLGDVFLECGR